ncbi:MAG: copper homeostasis protein [Bacteroidetes bacterium B1(2017)]|nr:MAG: copper homeostasis protein [Bacteroidetes bacterium B1(2017)]
MSDLFLEIACFNTPSALLAERAGASRIELCSNKNLDGLTPNFEEFEEIRKLLNTKIHIMIRPKGGNFIYSSEEFERMKSDLIRFKELGADGFVFGCLDEQGEINLTQNQKLIELAGGLPCTFHKAFDVCINQSKSLKELIELGFSEVLTSGGKDTAMEGIKQLVLLNEIASNKIKILIGGSVRANNIKHISHLTSINRFHSSAILDGGETANYEEIDALLNCKAE